MLKPCPLKRAGGKGTEEMKTKNEYREYLADMFISAIEEKGLNWKKGWQGAESPKSAITGAPYKGVNRFALEMVSLVNQYEDPRWATFKQIQDKGWSLEKGAKGVQIEYWVPLHPETNKTTTWDVINKLKEAKPDILIQAVPQYYYVFNAEKIKGIPEREIIHNPDIKMENVVPKIAQNMGVEILDDGGNRAFYSLPEDKVHLPKTETFKTSYDYYATAMHELAHASGAAHRLNRDMSGSFGTPSYAFEELVAEMSSAFMSEHLPYELPEEQLDNHKAYLNSWMKAIKDNPDYLIQAIKKADTCANYLEEMGEIHQELQKEMQPEKSVANEINNVDISNMTMEQRYTEALKIAGYEIIPTPEGSPATITIRNLETGYELGSDGWGGIIEELEKIEDKSIYDKIEHLLHSQTDLYYYTQNLGGSGLDKNSEYVKHPDFESALEAFNGADLTDGKTIGIYIEGGYYDLAYYDSALNSFVIDNNLSLTNYWEDFRDYVSADMSYEDYKKIQENIQIINDSLGPERTYTNVLEGFRDIFDNSKGEMLLNNSIDGSWFGRIANDSRPQDYVQFEILGDEKNNEITALLTTVHGNEVVDVKDYEIKIPEGGFDKGVTQAFNQIGSYFTKDNNYIKEAAYNLDTDWDKKYTLYAPFMENEIDKHYQALANRGYESFPNYDNYNQRQTEQVKISLGDDVQQMNVPEQASPVELSEKKTELIKKVVDYDLQKMELQKGIDNFNQNIEETFKDIAAEDISKNGSIAEDTKQLMEAYGIKDKPFLENVQQIDSAKGDIHIYQDKKDAKKNYLGKKVENNGVKMIQKMSDAMDLKSAREKLKENIHHNQDRALQQSIKQPKPTISIGRGF